MAYRATRHGDIASTAIRVKGSSDEVSRRLGIFFAEERFDPQGVFAGDVKEGWVIVKLMYGNFLAPDFRGQIIEDVDKSFCTVELNVTPSPLVALLFAGLAIAFLLVLGMGMVFLPTMLGILPAILVIATCQIILISMFFFIVNIYMSIGRYFRKLLVHKLVSSDVAESQSWRAELLA